MSNVVEKHAIPLQSYAQSGFAKPQYDERFADCRFDHFYPVSGVKNASKRERVLNTANTLPFVFRFLPSAFVYRPKAALSSMM